MVLQSDNATEPYLQGAQITLSLHQRKGPPNALSRTVTSAIERLNAFVDLVWIDRAVCFSIVKS
jgi:hypothetical protein